MVMTMTVVVARSVRMHPAARRPRSRHRVRNIPSWPQRTREHCMVLRRQCAQAISGQPPFQSCPPSGGRRDDRDVIIREDDMSAHPRTGDHDPVTMTIVIIATASCQEQV